MEKELENSVPENIADIFSQSLKAEEKEKIMGWIKQSDSNQKLFWEFRDVWQGTALVKSNEYDENKAWKSLKPNLKIEKTTINLQWLKYASVAVIFSLVGYFSYYLLVSSPANPVKISFQEVYVPYGSTSKIVLPDGSFVWLNAGSYLKYDNYYNVNNRNVFLKGEGYFDVQKNKKLTFVVNTSGIEVKAIGTKFNVKSYPEEKLIYTTVVEGKIQIINKLENVKNKEELFLTQNQSASFLKENVEPPLIEPKIDSQKQLSAIKEIPSKILEIDSSINPDIFVSWHEGKMIIEREKLGSLAVKLERRYNVKINFLDETVKNYVFSGILKDETFEQIMEVIRLTSPIRYSVDGNKVELTVDKSLINRLK